MMLGERWTRHTHASEIKWTSLDAHGAVLEVGGTLPDGNQWTLTLGELIASLQAGRSYFLQYEGSAYRVALALDEDGRPTLTVGLNRDMTFLRLLPRRPNV